MIDSHHNLHFANDDQFQRRKKQGIGPSGIRGRGLSPDIEEPTMMLEPHLATHMVSLIAKACDVGDLLSLEQTK